jgi:LPXTG-motif cell wall-anchored protein
VPNRKSATFVTALRIIAANLILVLMATIYVRLLPYTGQWYTWFLYVGLIFFAAAAIYLLDRLIVILSTRNEFKRMQGELPYVREVYKESLNAGLGGLFYAVVSLLIVGGAALVLAIFLWQ